MSAADRYRVVTTREGAITYLRAGGVMVVPVLLVLGGLGLVVVLVALVGWGGRVAPSAGARSAEQGGDDGSLLALLAAGADGGDAGADAGCDGGGAGGD
jgi:hypothetical protein